MGEGSSKCCSKDSCKDTVDVDITEGSGDDDGFHADQASKLGTVKATNAEAEMKRLEEEEALRRAELEFGPIEDGPECLQSYDSAGRRISPTQTRPDGVTRRGIQDELVEEFRRDSMEAFAVEDAKDKQRAKELQRELDKKESESTSRPGTPGGKDTLGAKEASPRKNRSDYLSDLGPSPPVEDEIGGAGAGINLTDRVGLSEEVRLKERVYSFASGMGERNASKGTLGTTPEESGETDPKKKGRNSKISMSSESQLIPKRKSGREGTNPKDEPKKPSKGRSSRNSLTLSLESQHPERRSSKGRISNREGANSKDDITSTSKRNASKSSLLSSDKKTVASKN